MNNHPEIQHAAANLARAESELQNAQQLHEAAMAEVCTIEGRLQAVAARRTKIREGLAAGTLDDRQAGGLLALVAEDAADLQQLLADAQDRAAAAVPMAEQNALSMAKNAIERVGREIAFEALHGRVAELEHAFLSALGTLYAQGQTLGRGRSLTGIYRPTDELRRVLVHNAPPAGPRHD